MLQIHYLLTVEGESIHFLKPVDLTRYSAEKIEGRVAILLSGQAFGQG